MLFAIGRRFTMCACDVWWCEITSVQVLLRVMYVTFTLDVQTCPKPPGPLRGPISREADPTRSKAQVHILNGSVALYLKLPVRGAASYHPGPDGEFVLPAEVRLQMG